MTLTWPRSNLSEPTRREVWDRTSGLGATGGLCAESSALGGPAALRGWANGDAAGLCVKSSALCGDAAGLCVVSSGLGGPPGLCAGSRGLDASAA